MLARQIWQTNMVQILTQYSLDFQINIFKTKNDSEGLENKIEMPEHKYFRAQSGFHVLC